MSALDRTTDLFQALSDPSRLRMLAVLSRHELAVAELVEALGLVQSRVSTHLSRLKEAGLVRTLKDGSTARWALDASGLDGASQGIWEATLAQLGAPHFGRDVERAAAVVARRAAPKGSWPEAVAGEMEKHYSPGRTWESMARGLSQLLALGDVLDVGSGDGTVAALIAPHAASCTCLDVSERMAAAARARLSSLSNVRVTVGDAEALPFPDASFDVVLFLNMLACLPHPERALVEAARVLRPGGRVLAVTLDRHDHLDLVERYGHRHAGIPPARLRTWLTRAELTVEACAVTSHERREPRFGVVTAVAHKSPSGSLTAALAKARAPSHKVAPPPPKKGRKKVVAP